MIFYATFLRAMASIIITNSHYTTVYPIKLIASGGLLGDILFFSISGFVLINIRQKFIKWYKKRIIRIYPSIWIITSVYILLGFYTFQDWTLIEYFIYPTYYHFIASIIILYIPYYIIIKNDFLYKNIPKVMIFIFLIQLFIYIIFYDKSYYHIDNVREPMIRFLFLQSMLLGLYFRKFDKKFRDSNKFSNWVMLGLTSVFYFMSKLAFGNIQSISNFQILNQIFIFITLYYFFKAFAGIDTQLENLPLEFKNIIKFLGKLTLEIYAVQYVIIPNLSDLIFPLNWILITVLILLTAYLLNLIGNKTSNIIQTKTNKLFFEDD